MGRMRALTRAKGTSEADCAGMTLSILSRKGVFPERSQACNQMDSGLEYSNVDGLEYTNVDLDQSCNLWIGTASNLLTERHS